MPDTEAPKRITLSREEARELHAYLYAAYTDPNRWPQLRRLITRLDDYLMAETEFQEVGS